MKKERIPVANRILQTFESGAKAEFVLSDAGRLRIKTQHGSKPATVANNSGALSCNYGQLGFGGTSAMAIGQLVRWIRNKTRLPVACWEYWASDTIKLCNDETVQLIEKSGYCDPKKTCCVLCGYEYTGDWWDLDGVVGPCCSMGRCQQRKKPTSKHCSTVIESRLLLKIECVHCQSINYASDTIDDDPSKCDIEEITCWHCDKNSLIDTDLLEMYPDYPNESVGGHHMGMNGIQSEGVKP